MTSISVLMSVYKIETPVYLDMALESVWDKQIRKPNEIVLVQDGPLGEQLRSVIYKWQSKIGSAMKIIVNEQNLGLARSLNRGMQFTTGEFIARMDSDDIALPERFMLQAEYLERHLDVSVLGGAIQEFNHLDDNIGIRHYPLTNDAILAYICKASPLAHPNVMIRREVFDSGISYNENYPLNEDIALWFDVLVSGQKIANLETVTLKFRREDSVYKRRSIIKAKHELRAYLYGISRLYGRFSPKQIYPVVRYLFRIMPVFVVKAVYNSKLRAMFLNKK